MVKLNLKLTFVYSKANKSAQTIVVEGRKGGKQGLDIQQPFIFTIKMVHIVMK